MTWAPDYVTWPDLKAYLRITSSAESIDTFGASWVTTVSRNIDDYCGRQFGLTAAAEARVYPSTFDRDLCRYVTFVDDLPSVDDLTIVDESGTTVTDFTLEPFNAAFKGLPYERIISGAGGNLTVSERWGWTAVPEAVKTALYLQGARLAARRDSPFGISGSPQQQGEIRLLAQLDPDFRTSLKPLRRKWWAA